MNLTYFKNVFNTQFNFGLFYNDLYFYMFEIFFIFSLIWALVFFVFVANKKTVNGYFFKVTDVLVNIFSFILLVLLLLSYNNTDYAYSIFNNFYYNDSSINFFKNLMVIFGILFVPTIKTYLAGLKNYDFEFVLVLFFSFFSSILLLNSNDLISLFFIIELQSLSFYIIVASKQTSSFSTEAGLKYFILGSFSSGLMLFGISLIYGFTGLLSFSDLSLFCSEIFNLYYINKLVALSFILGVLMLTVGLVFKFGAAPFHMWMPDVYEGSPLLITAYLSTLPKISLLFIFLKIYYGVFFELFTFLQILFIAVAILSIIWGSVAAIYQIKVKRLLTYSMITNTGYIFLGLALFDITGVYITIFYLISYVFIMLGLFLSFISLRDRSNGLLVKKITSFANLLESNSYLSLSIFILLFSIAGIPPLLGFYGKMLLFYFSLKLKFYLVSILFVVFSAASVFYYIRLVKLMYFNRQVGKIFLYDISFLTSFVISFIVIINFIFFINPNFVFKTIYNLSFFIYI